MSGGLGPGRRGSYHSRTGASTPSGRPGRGGGGNDNVLPLLTGVLGSSILAFSLYVFSQKPGVLGAEANEPTVQPEDGQCYEGDQPCSGAEPSDANFVPLQQNCPAAQPCPYANEPKINIEKKRWLSPEEEAILREKEQNRGKLQKELKQHLRKVKELTEELERDEQAKKRKWRDWRDW